MAAGNKVNVSFRDMEFHNQGRNHKLNFHIQRQNPQPIDNHPAAQRACNPRFCIKRGCRVLTRGMNFCFLIGARTYDKNDKRLNIGYFNYSAIYGH